MEEETRVLVLHMEGTHLTVEVVGAQTADTVLNALVAATGIMFEKYNAVDKGIDMTFTEFWDAAGKLARSTANATLAGDIITKDTSGC